MNAIFFIMFIVFIVFLFFTDEANTILKALMFLFKVIKNETIVKVKKYYCKNRCEVTYRKQLEIQNIHTFIKRYIKKKDYESLNDFMQDINIQRLDSEELMAYLKYTLKIKDKLPYREKFLSEVKQEINERGEEVILA